MRHRQTKGPETDRSDLPNRVTPRLYIIEGACRHLVDDRMNLTGARWRLSGAEALLRLRALRSSDDFDVYWKFHEEQEYTRNHASHCTDHSVPKVALPPAHLSRPSRRNHLKLIKKKQSRNRPRTSELALNFIEIRKSKRAAPF
jgi:hypothetical protein